MGYNQMNVCAYCREPFLSYFEYSEHLALMEHNKPLEYEARPIEIESSEASAQRIVVSGRQDLAKQAYKGPMAKQEKQRIVRKGEIRLGLMYFFGVAA